MFNRLRYTVQVLSSPEKSPYHDPDITFVEEKAPEISKTSKLIASLIEVMVVSALIGTVMSLFHDHLPFNKDLKVTGLTALSVFVLLFAYQQLMGRIHTSVGQQLKIGERVAPYFGHRITRLLKVVRS